MNNRAYRWVFPSYSDYACTYPLSRFQKEVLWNRGCRSQDSVEHFFHPQTYSPKLFKDFITTEQRIIHALESKEKLLVYGDYDVDGMTSAALLYQFFQVYEYLKKKKLSVEVSFPQRGIDGYGLQEKTVEYAHKKGISLLIAVDNGITSHTAIERARHYKIDVLVIDHHNIVGSPPPAYAILNPRQEDCQYPYKEFASVGLVYKLVSSLSEQCFDDETAQFFQKRYTDLVAIGTYQDRALLIGENRVLVESGMQTLNELLSNRQTNLHGLLELLKLRQIHTLEYNTLGFLLGPLLNSAGRIGNPQTAFRLLTTRNKAEASLLAQELQVLNEERRRMILQAFQQAQDIITQKALHKERIIILQSESWHEGIIGLIAQRVSEQYSRSVIVMSSLHHPYYTGSARAYGSLNIGKIITDLEKYLLHCGGHQSAAGFSVEPEQLPVFVRAVQDTVAQYHEAPKEIQVDAQLSLQQLKTLHKDLQLLEPFGEGNPCPIILITALQVTDVRKSRRGLDSLLRFSDTNESIHITAFNTLHYYQSLRIGDYSDILCQVSLQKHSLHLELLDIKKPKISSQIHHILP